MNLKNGKLFTSKSVWTGPSSYEKRIYQVAVSQILRNTGLDHSSLDRMSRPKTNYFSNFIATTSGAQEDGR